MVTEKSCGGVVFLDDGWRKYLLIRHRIESGGHWDFPKGHVEKGESDQETALREIYEEAGLKVDIMHGFKESISYVDHMHNVDKIVVFFLCVSHSSEVKHITDDVIDHIWLGFEDALKKLTYDNARNVLRKAEKFLSEND